MIDCNQLTHVRCAEAFVAAYPLFAAAVTAGLATLISACIAWAAATATVRNSRKREQNEAAMRGMALIEEAARRSRLQFGMCNAILRAEALDKWNISHRTLMVNRLQRTESELADYCRRAWALMDKISGPQLGLLAHHLTRLEDIVAYNATIFSMITDPAHKIQVGDEILTQQLDLTCDQIIDLAIEIEPALKSERVNRKRPRAAKPVEEAGA